ncbi:MAG TPA: hypothetical protein VEG39_07910 [Clostridia bacterium]|nr:hypothetical protein [Clostridia bacterium]
MNKEVILNFLPMVANKYLLLNAIMHILIYGVLAMVFLSGSKWKRIAFDSMIVLLLVSVAAISILNGNPFNFLTFTILSVFAVIELFKAENDIKFDVFSLNTLACIAIILVGLWYPHFANTHPVLMLLLAPTGIIPCPTLMVVLGLLNLVYPKINRGLYTVTSLMGVFYGATGIFMLKVTLDVPLLLIAAYSVYNLKFLFIKPDRNIKRVI